MRETVGGGRVVETLIGAAVGVLVNVVFPPAVQTRYATRAVQDFAGEIAGLLHDAAATLRPGPVTVEQSSRWLEDARRLNRHAPRVDRALAHAEDSRRLNLRALRVPPVGVGTRTGLAALEHTSVSLRTLFRAIDDATRERTGVEEDADYAELIRRTTASLLERMGNVVHEAGRVLTAETPGGGRGADRLAASLEALRSGRALVQDLLIDDPRSRTGLWGLNSTLLAAIDRMVAEIEAIDRAPARTVPGDTVSARRAAVRAGRRLRVTRRGHPRAAASVRGSGEDTG